MTTGRLPTSRMSGIAPVAALVLIISLVAGHPAIAEVLGGAVILLGAALIGASLARRAAIEADPGKHLLLDLSLVAVVLLALLGVAVIGMAIPIRA
jgi:hypothetical protein